MNSPPSCAFQNWLPMRTAAVQLISVPRFFGEGQIARVPIMATKAASTGSLKTASLTGRAQNPSSVTSLGKIQPNICRSWPEKIAVLGDRSAKAATRSARATATPTANRRIPRSQ